MSNQPATTPTAPAELLAHVLTILTAHHWKFAKTMADTPHWYTLRERWKNDPLFDEVVMFIRKYGYVEFYKGRRYVMMNFGEFKYWTMGSPLDNTILINRTYIDAGQQAKLAEMIVANPAMVNDLHIEV